jgi:hypothetical protein
MTVPGQSLIINRADMAEARLMRTDHAMPPAPGTALMRVDTFALTANTITYGVASDSLGYWNFFPGGVDGFGHIPAWGFVEVIASAAPGVEAGQRFYGYVPMATHLVVAPGKITPQGFVDISAHRRPMAPIYNHYALTDADPAYSRGAEAQIALFRPLFTTAFLLGDLHRETGAFGATQLLLSSASSKTAIGLAADLTRARPEGVQVVGLTSAGNAGFVERLGLYDRVIAYDAVEELPRGPTAYVDFSGNGGLMQRIHGHFGHQMRRSTQVGLTDWQNAQLRFPDLPGPKPEFFFAPSYAQQRLADWGRDGFQARLGAAWDSFIGTTGWLRVTETSGPEAVRARYLAALQGGFYPATGDMLSMWG